MKKAHSSWSPEETDLVTKIIKQFDASPSRAYVTHPEWKTRLGANHTQGAIYAKIHALRGPKKPVAGKPITVPIGVKTTPEAAMAGSRFIVVDDGQIENISCPKCAHKFHLIQRP